MSDGGPPGRSGRRRDVGKGDGLATRDLHDLRNFTSAVSFKDLINDKFGLWRGSVGLVLQF